MNNNTIVNKIWLEGNTIFYKSPFITREIALSDIMIIGEFTNQDGPDIDDYFLVFVVKSFKGWYEFSFYAKGMELFIEKLNEELEISIEFKLCNSSDFKSRIMYPKSLIDMQLFDFIELKKPFWNFWDNEVNQNLTPEVIKYINNLK